MSTHKTFMGQHWNNWSPSPKRYFYKRWLTKPTFFESLGVGVANDSWERGVGSKISCLSLNVSEGGLWCLPAKPALLLCDGSTTENREQTTADRLVLEMLLFKNLRTSRNFQKQLLQFFLLKSTNRRNYWDACHVKMGIRSKSSKCHFSIGSAAGQSDGPTGQGPRTVTFQKKFAPLEIFNNSNSSQ